MTRPAFPTRRRLDGRDAIPLGILAVLAVWLLGAVDLWVAARLALALSGHGGHGVGFGPLGRDILAAAGGGTARLAPGAPAWLVWALVGLLIAGELAGGGLLGVRLGRRLTGLASPAASMARPGDVAALTERHAATRARALRPSLASRGRLDLADIGMRLGRLVPGGAPLYGSWEDVWLLFMAPRSGKTTGYAVPLVLAAPGPALLTSNKGDAWTATAALRGRTGQVWTFDPQRIVHAPRTWWWDPLVGVTTIEDADRLAGHFIAEVLSEKDPFWSRAAAELLSGVLLAAAVAGGTMHDVWAWLNDTTAAEPVEVLSAAGYPGIAAGLRGTAAGAPDTTQGIYQTARTAARCLRDPVIMAWVTPPGRHRTGGRVAAFDPAAFDPAAFASSSDTLYLLSKDGAGSAAPLVAALTDRVFHDAVRAAETQGGRLDPPLVAVLDEAANICKIADLPDLYSHLGSRGIPVVTILQSYQQGARVWGEHGVGALWSAATCKIIGAGIDDPRFASDLSTLVGRHYVPYRSVSHSPRQGWSETDSVHQEPILEPAQIRALPKGQALLLATGYPVAMLRTEPWYDGPHAREIRAANAHAEAGIRQRATATHAAAEAEAEGGVVQPLRRRRQATS